MATCMNCIPCIPTYLITSQDEDDDQYDDVDGDEGDDEDVGDEEEQDDDEEDEDYVNDDEEDEDTKRKVCVNYNVLCIHVYSYVQTRHNLIGFTIFNINSCLCNHIVYRPRPRPRLTL